MKFILAIASLILLACQFVFAQAPPVGTGPGGQWTLHSVSRQGHYYGIGYQLVFGMPMEVPFDMPWGSSNGGAQAVNSTSQPFTVWAKSEGKTVYTYRWVGSSSAPSRVLVDVFASSKAWCSTSGTVTASNGFGSPMDRQENYVAMEGSRKKVYDGSSGVVVIEVPTFAEAYGSESAGVEQYSYPGILLRDVTVGIAGHGVTYRKRITGNTVFSLRGGTYPEAVKELVLPEENSAGELFHVTYIGLPLKKWDVWDAAIHYTHVDAGAFAWGDHVPIELYEWTTPMDSSSGRLPNLFSGWELPTVGVQNFYWPRKERDQSITKNGVDTFADASIKYTWNDGYTVTSRVRAQAKHLRENSTIFRSIDYTEDGQLTWDINEFTVLSTVSGKDGWTELGDPNLTCLLLKRDAFLSGQTGTIVVLTSAGSEFIPSWPVKILMMVAGLLYQEEMPEDKTGPFSESLQKFQEAIANTPTYGNWVDHKPIGLITEERMREYVWRVLGHKLYQTDWWVSDAYGDTGYQGQVEEFVRWQKSIRYGYQYKRVQGPGGVL